MPDDVDRFLEGYAPDIRGLAQQVRALIASVAPDADESLKPGWKVIWYGFGTKMPEQFAVVMPTKNHVGLGFTHGTELPDPAGKLEGTGKRMRHVTLRTAADVADPSVATMLRVQVALRKAGAKGMKPTRATARRKPRPAARPRSAARRRG